VDNIAAPPPPRDGLVTGTTGADLIDTAYRGDPDGDRIDARDAIIPGDTPDSDRVFALGGNDTVRAGKENDTVFGGDGNDSLLGDAGDDDLNGDAGRDTLFGGEGDDRLGGDDGDDRLEGDNGDDTLRGEDGNDRLLGENGEDDLGGGAGNDILEGGNGRDTLTGGSGNDTIGGGEGEDTVDAGSGRDSVTGDNGDDLLDTSGTQAPDIDVPPFGGFPGYPADADPFDDRDTVFGGSGDDTIRSGDDADSIFGGRGDDVIDAGVDDDTLNAGDGDDTVTGGEGNDRIEAGTGDDLVFGGLSDAFDPLNITDDRDPRPNNGRDTIFGGDGDDTIDGKDDADVVAGGDGDDSVSGGIDNDTVEGNDGDDRILGEHGDDVLTGDDGDDTLVGGIGADTMAGGADRDLFLGANAGDRVNGNETGDDFDTLDLRGSGPLRIVYDGDNAENGTVTFRDAAGNPTGTMRFTNIENVVPCFTPGTLIATPKGEVPVETLRAGDRIITRDNGIQDIVWTGSRTLTWPELQVAHHLRPVLVRRGTLGHGLPERDLLVSPNHRLLVANDRTALYFDEHEVLVAAKHLIGARGVLQVDAAGVTYIHFMCAAHQVVLSDGAWTESFQPGDTTLKGMGNAQRTEIYELFPDLKSAQGVADYAAARRTLRRHEARLLMR
jgi:Ca2+-binding RTX toxin-like protein